MHRLFVPKEQLPIVRDADAHYIKNVLRLQIGDQLELLDGSGQVYLTEIENINKAQVSCKVISSLKAQSEMKTKVTIAQSLPKAAKMETIIQKTTELGAVKIIPMLTERSIAKKAKLDRWQKIAKEAAEQSGRAVIPEIAQLAKLEDVLGLREKYDLAIIPWELEKKQALKDLLRNSSEVKSIIILIGPEGGFPQTEVKAAKTAGFCSITLGSRILRTETAGPAILSMINYEFE